MFGIHNWRTNSCCCGISLRTGTIAIIFLSLISGVCMTCNHDKIQSNVISAISLWTGEIIFTAIELAALYGVFTNKPDFLIPHLVVTVVFLVTLLLFIIGLLVLLPFAAIFLDKAYVTIETPDGKTENVDGQVVKDSFYAVYALVIVLALINEVVEFYFFIVVLSYYEYLKTSFSSINPPPVNDFVA